MLKSSIHFFMITKSLLILSGTLMLFVSTALKSQLYQIDLILNAIAFPMYLLIFSFIVQSLRAKQSESYVLLDISIVLYLLYGYLFSLLALLITLLLFSLVLFAHKIYKDERKTEIDFDTISLMSHFKENRKLYKLNLLFSMCIIYYFIFFELVHRQLIVVSPDFW